MFVRTNSFLFVSTKGPREQLRYHENRIEIGVQLLFFFGGTRASHCCGLSHCGAQAPDAQAQRPWLTGPAAPRHVGSSRTGARTRVPCLGRQTLNSCATRDALPGAFDQRQPADLTRQN